MCYLTFSIMCARAHWYWFGTLFRDNGLHKLVFNVLLDGTEVAYYVDGQVVRPRAISWFCSIHLVLSLVYTLHSMMQRKVDGYIKDQRIYCNHCNRVVWLFSHPSYFFRFIIYVMKQLIFFCVWNIQVSPSAFEAHAGEGSRRKP